MSVLQVYRLQMCSICVPAPQLLTLISPQLLVSSFSLIIIELLAGILCVLRATEGVTL